MLTAEIAEMEQRDQINKITDGIIGGAIDVHRALGSGLLESAYEACLAFELTDLGHRIERQKQMPISYRGVQVDAGYRLDLVVDDLVVVELKAVERIEPIHRAQLLSYLKLSGLSVGLLINFNVKVLKNGVRRLVNNLPESPRSQRSQR